MFVLQLSREIWFDLAIRGTIYWAIPKDEKIGGVFKTTKSESPISLLVQITEGAE